jgi:hypothetical protein
MRRLIIAVALATLAMSADAHATDPPTYAFDANSTIPGSTPTAART